MKKDILLIFVLVLFAVFVIRGVDIRSVDDYYDAHPEEVRPGSKTVTLSIDCRTIYDHYDDLEEALKKGEYLPKDGWILPETTIVLEEGDSVFDVLIRATRIYHIPMEYQGTDQNIYNSVYVQGIQYLYEFSCGPLSGWTYAVNGEPADVGCSMKKPADGDKITFIYTCELGRDIGFPVPETGGNP